MGPLPVTERRREVEAPRATLEADLGGTFKEHGISNGDSTARCAVRGAAVQWAAATTKRAGRPRAAPRATGQKALESAITS